MIRPLALALTRLATACERPHAAADAERHATDARDDHLAHIKALTWKSDFGDRQELDDPAIPRATLENPTQHEQRPPTRSPGRREGRSPGTQAGASWLARRAPPNAKSPRLCAVLRFG